MVILISLPRSWLQKFLMLFVKNVCWSMAKTIRKLVFSQTTRRQLSDHKFANIKIQINISLSAQDIKIELSLILKMLKSTKSRNSNRLMVNWILPIVNGKLMLFWALMQWTKFWDQKLSLKFKRLKMLKSKWHFRQRNLRSLEDKWPKFWDRVNKLNVSSILIFDNGT